jgi:hypothetical protein
LGSGIGATLWISVLHWRLAGLSLSIHIHLVVRKRTQKLYCERRRRINAIFGWVGLAADQGDRVSREANAGTLTMLKNAGLSCPATGADWQGQQKRKFCNCTELSALQHVSNRPSVTGVSV